MLTRVKKNADPGEEIDEIKEAHFDAGAGVAVPPAPHAHLQVGKTSEPDIDQVKVDLVKVGQT